MCVRQRTRRFLVALVILLAASAFATAKPWPKYEGAWFSVSYPPGWSVRPSLKSKTSDKGYDSVFFQSPDRKAEFYVFSPQWNGNPTDIKLKPRIEKQISQKLQVKGTSTAALVTIRAKNKSYNRSYVDRQDSAANTRVVFGIKYTKSTTHKKYKYLYAKFKGSLAQFGD
jgi:hypothetical protein